MTDLELFSQIVENATSLPVYMGKTKGFLTAV